MKARQVVIAVVAVVLTWKLGWPMTRLLWSLIASGFGALFGTSAGAVGDPGSLRAAIRNVTTDYDQASPPLQLTESILSSHRTGVAQGC